MNSLNNSSVLSLLPTSLQVDEDIKAAVITLDRSTSELLQYARKLSFFVNPLITEHNLLDAVAADLHVDFYDKSFSIDIKQALIRNSFTLHMSKGTPQAVEDLISTVFGEGIVEEWFEYGGEPFHFRIVTNNESITNERAQEFIRALETVKRKSAILESVTINQVETMDIFIGAFVHSGDKYLFKQVV
ncbi:MAG: phage tail protein I [Paenisporosarcina sp.]